MAISGNPRLHRVAAVWAAVSLMVAVDAVATVPVLLQPNFLSRFDAFFVFVCSASALLAGIRLWWIATTVVVMTVTGHIDHPRWRHGRPIGPLTRCVLLACGVAALYVAGPIVTASADPGSGSTETTSTVAALDGLPLPDRTVGGLGRSTRMAPVAPTDFPLVVVRRGDTLWAIAERQLSPTTPATDIAGYVRRLHQSNRKEIGLDPDLIQPGQVLRLPGTTP